MSDEFKTFRANAEGFDGDKVRVEGEVFTTNIPQGSWMDLLDKDGNVVDRPKHKPAPATGKSDSAAADKLAKENAELRAEIEQLKAGGAPTGQPNPGPLDLSVPDLTIYVEDISDVGAIDALITAETEGKSRTTALAVLEARKVALQGS